ncbi:MAG: 30S ribosomal protein S9 [Chloroflexi bacterium]|nr:MAG: 30S ribosomal protein S9 [Chloroflexi bacterium OLB13]MBC6956333.1 30S ribosomal protein S9 [Chloroflexota bacterium]MBV6434890.1 30S ribosomal protein S9 [Anaerolineae bacterium]MDL1916302.1 30S ribosomal protein S9 [Anaerolineae bacterium CFX4]MBW7878573.1 30S ribosomal protein S9 [Anaerolineae bacterium]
MASQYYEGIGRRKAASARVRIYPGGTGNYVVNERDASEYLTRPGDIEISLEPLRVVGQEGNYDISVHVYGGGVSGQRDAIRLGVARALLEVDAEFRGQLKPAKLLTRDARVKERKKPGLKRARKAPTYTKR